MTTNTELYNIAKKYIGTKGADAKKYCGLPSGAPWCDAYVSFIFYKGGIKSLYCNGAKETYCPHSIQICKSKMAQIPPYLAMPMDIIFFDWELNGTPNHIGFVKKRKSTTEIYTHEGNTSGGIVAEKTRTAKYVQAIFRPHYPAKYNISKPLAIDGSCGYNTIAMLQLALGIEVTGILDKRTVKALQTAAGATPDGAWAKKTSRAVQRLVGATVDGDFGINSVKAMQRWINKRTQKKTNKIVDVSYWQHDIDWTKVSSEVDGVIARASYTSQSNFVLSEDSTFADNVKGAFEHGLRVGAYHYSQAISVSEAKREAEFICKKLNAYKSKITLPVVCDWEFGKRLNSTKAKSIGKKGCTEIIEAFCDTVVDYGYTPMVYANYSTFKNYLNFDELQKKYLIWLAQYNDTASLPYDYWQYTSSGSISGIKGNVDISKIGKRKSDLILDCIDAIAWPYGTPKKLWDYETGNPTPDCEAAMKKYMKANTKARLSDCGFFVSTVIRMAGIDSTFKCLNWTYPKTFSVVHKGGKIPDGLLMPGDVIRYRKRPKGTHTMIYYGDEKIAEAGRKIRFGVIQNDTKKYNGNNINLSTLEVLRAKE